MVGRKKSNTFKLLFHLSGRLFEQHEEPVSAHGPCTIYLPHAAATTGVNVINIRIFVLQPFSRIFAINMHHLRTYELDLIGINLQIKLIFCILLVHILVGINVDVLLINRIIYY